MINESILPIIPGYNTFLIIAIIGTSTVILTKKIATKMLVNK
jgi:hypothetical protein